MASTIERGADQPKGLVYGTLADVDEIRLLHLQPGGFDDPIICQLVHANFLDKPQYEALSYMWGSKDDPLQIELNGTETISGKLSITYAMPNQFELSG